MKTIEELANLGTAAALPICRPKGTWTISLHTEAIYYKDDQPAREAFAAAVRDAVLADQPATWRPIVELPENTDIRYAFTNGVTCWGTDARGATHFITPPPKPDPFEAWYVRWHKVWSEDRNAARIAYDAARGAKP